MMRRIVMLTGIRQRTRVTEGGRIEIPSSELPSGALVEVIVLIEQEAVDTTEYLLSTEANRAHLREALRDLNDPSSYHYVALEDK
jgi:antitoxin YefM